MSTTFDFTGDEQTYVVPSHVRQIDVDIWGANGGAASSDKIGYGGYVRTRFNVNPGETLHVYPGAAGNSTDGGFGFDKVNGGNAGSTEEDVFGGGAGSFITRDPDAPIDEAVVVAGGGGGAGVSRTAIVGGGFQYRHYRGGFGGGYRGSNGFPFNNAVAGGGAVSSVAVGEGGSPNGGDGEDGLGGAPQGDAFAGGGGGGLRGGGSGGQTTSEQNFVSGSGGGGSGGVPGCCVQAALVNVQYENVNYNRTSNPNLYASGNGFVIITPVVPFSSIPCCITNFQVPHLANAQIQQQFRNFNRNNPRPGSSYNSVN